MNIDIKNKILAARGSNLRNQVRPLPKVQDGESRMKMVDKLVFAPNVFGWPSNDIDVMNNTSNPEVKIALERRNMKMPSVHGVEDDDVALDVMQHNDESSQEYFDRMQPIIEKAKKSQNK